MLAYRIWEIAENILIDRTQTFDQLLSNGDHLSSYTLTETSKSETLSEPQDTTEQIRLDVYD